MGTASPYRQLVATPVATGNTRAGNIDIHIHAVVPMGGLGGAAASPGSANAAVGLQAVPQMALGGRAGNNALARIFAGMGSGGGDAGGGANTAASAATQVTQGVTSAATPDPTSASPPVPAPLPPRDTAQAEIRVARSSGSGSGSGSGSSSSGGGIRSRRGVRGSGVVAAVPTHPSVAPLLGPPAPLASGRDMSAEIRNAGGLENFLESAGLTGEAADQGSPASSPQRQSESSSSSSTQSAAAGDDSMGMLFSLLHQAGADRRRSDEGRSRFRGSSDAEERRRRRRQVRRQQGLQVVREELTRLRQGCQGQALPGAIPSPTRGGVHDDEGGASAGGSGDGSGGIYPHGDVRNMVLPYGGSGSGSGVDLRRIRGFTPPRRGSRRASDNAGPTTPRLVRDLLGGDGIIPPMESRFSLDMPTFAVPSASSTADVEEAHPFPDRAPSPIVPPAAGRDESADIDRTDTNRCAHQ